MRYLTMLAFSILLTWFSIQSCKCNKTEHNKPDTSEQDAPAAPIKVDRAEEFPIEHQQH